MSVAVHRAADRFVTRTGWLESRHCFSFGSHYDPANTGHGVLVAHNDDRVRAGTGFDPHPHRDMEIVTWVLSGSLVHEDSEGHRGVLHPGLVQRMSAGSGIQHSERAADQDVRLVQMWVHPAETGRAPSYEQQDVSAALAAGGLVRLAAARDAAITIGTPYAALHVARLPAGGSVTLPDAPLLHLFVARGAGDLEGTGQLSDGDAVRTATGGQRLTATDPAEVLVWELQR